MTYASITHVEKLKYTHLYKLDTTFQNTYMSYEPSPPSYITFDIIEKESVVLGLCAAAYGNSAFSNR